MNARRYELTDFEWSIIEPLLPNKPRDVPRSDDQYVGLNVSLKEIEALLKVWRSTGEHVTLHRRVLRHARPTLPPNDDRAGGWRRDGRCFHGDSG